MGQVVADSHPSVVTVNVISHVLLFYEVFSFIKNIADLTFTVRRLADNFTLQFLLKMHLSRSDHKWTAKRHHCLHPPLNISRSLLFIFVTAASLPPAYNMESDYEHAYNIYNAKATWPNAVQTTLASGLSDWITMRLGGSLHLYLALMICDINPRCILKTKCKTQSQIPVRSIVILILILLSS